MKTLLWDIMVPNVVVWFNLASKRNYSFVPVEKYDMTGLRIFQSKSESFVSAVVLDIQDLTTLVVRLGWVLGLY